MPRRRKAAREFRRTAPASVAEMRKRFRGDSLPFFLITAVHGDVFFRELPSVAERRTFAQAFPAEFYKLFSFFRPVVEYPAETMYGVPFRRLADEFLEMIEKHPPRPFDPPSIWELPYRERIPALTAARGRWWRANGLPMTAEEADWLRLNEKIAAIDRKENQ